MEKLHYSILINAPPEKVYKTMLEDETYRQWTTAFNPVCYYEGDWSEGSIMRFLGPNKDGSVSGMLSRVKANKPNEFVSIEHFGEIINGVEDTTSDRIKIWAGGQENYTFIKKSDGTELQVDLDTPAEYKNMFAEMWPKALEKLKALTEK